MSTFRIDGYQDGKAGKKASPPAPYEFAGHVTNVFACEYLQGWQDGHREYRQQCEADERALFLADREAQDYRIFGFTPL